MIRYYQGKTTINSNLILAEWVTYKLENNYTIRVIAEKE